MIQVGTLNTPEGRDLEGVLRMQVQAGGLNNIEIVAAGQPCDLLVSDLPGDFAQAGVVDAAVLIVVATESTPEALDRRQLASLAEAGQVRAWIGAVLPRGEDTAGWILGLVAALWSAASTQEALDLASREVNPLDIWFEGQDLGYGGWARVQGRGGGATTASRRDETVGAIPPGAAGITEPSWRDVASASDNVLIDAADLRRTEERASTDREVWRPPWVEDQIEYQWDAAVRAARPAPSSVPPGPLRKSRAARPPQEAPAAVGQTPPRYLQSRVLDRRGRERRKAFAADEPNTLEVWIGPPGDSLVAPTALDERTIDRDSAGEARLLIEVVDSASGATVPQRVAVRLPREGSTIRHAFELEPAPAAPRREVTILVMQGSRVLQRALIAGTVRRGDTASRRDALHFENMVIAEPGSAGSVSASLVDTGHNQFVAHEGNKRGRILDLQGLLQEAQNLAARLEEVVAPTDRDEPEEWVAFWHGLATQGSVLRTKLHECGLQQLDNARRIQVLGGDDDAIVPLEVVFDGGQPTDAARPCGQWQETLAAGRCSTCDPHPRPPDDPTDTICPLAFWGLAKVIERQAFHPGNWAASLSILSSARAGGRRGTLPLPATVLVGLSDKVQQSTPTAADPRLELLARLKAFNMKVVEVKSWTQWAKKVASERPTVLIAIVHTDGEALELNGKLLRINAITRDYVSPADGDPPIVLLVGCRTVSTRRPLASFTALFQNAHAGVVVGSLSSVIPDDAVAAAVGIVSELVAPGRKARTFGDAMLAVRRSLLAAGKPTGLALAAYGDTRWRLAGGVTQ